MPAGVNAATTKPIASKGKALLNYLGKDEDALLPIAIMCGANAVFKPLITLSNTKESKGRKLYAAEREFLNELVALPVCLGMAVGSKKLGEMLMGKALSKVVGEPAKKAVQNKLNILQTTVFSSIGVIGANFIVPSLAAAIFHPLEKATAPLLKKFGAAPQASASTPAEKPGSMQPSAPQAAPRPVRPLAQPTFGHKISPFAGMNRSLPAMPGYRGPY